MPPTLYPDTLHTCRTPWLDPSTQTALPDLPTTEQHALLTAYTACIVEVLATKRPLRSVLVALKAVAAGRAAQQPVGSQASTQPAAPTTQQPPQQPAGSEGTILSAQGAQGGCLGAVLACELLETCRHAHIPARIEALAGLRGLVEHYLQVLPGASWCAYHCCYMCAHAFVYACTRPYSGTWLPVYESVYRQVRVYYRPVSSSQVRGRKAGRQA